MTPKTAADFVHEYRDGDRTRYVLASFDRARVSYTAPLTKRAVRDSSGCTALSGRTPGSVAQSTTHTYATRTAAIRAARQIFEGQIDGD